MDDCNGIFDTQEVSIPKRVSEVLKPHEGVKFTPVLPVSIPKRVSEVLKPSDQHWCTAIEELFSFNP